MSSERLMNTAGALEQLCVRRKRKRSYACAKKMGLHRRGIRASPTDDLISCLRCPEPDFLLVEMMGTQKCKIALHVSS